MKRINWSTFKFHPHYLGELMTNDRTGTKMGKTVEGKLLEIWIEAKYGRKNIVDNKQLQKGIICETDSLELVSEVSKRHLFKNNKTLENDYLIGTPDVISPKLIDVKTSWNAFTFFSMNEKKALDAYYWQLLGYMDLTGQKSADLWFALVDTPLELVWDKEYEMYPQNFQFGDIPAKQRVKKFTIKLNAEDIAKMKTRLDECREYLKGLK